MKSFVLLLDTDNEKETTCQSMYINGKHICFLNFILKDSKETAENCDAINFTMVDGIHYAVQFDSRDEFIELQRYIDSDEPESFNKVFKCKAVEGQQHNFSRYHY